MESSSASGSDTQTGSSSEPKHHVSEDGAVSGIVSLAPIEESEPTASLDNGDKKAEDSPAVKANKSKNWKIWLSHFEFSRQNFPGSIYTSLKSFYCCLLKSRGDKSKIQKKFGIPFSYEPDKPGYDNIELYDKCLSLAKQIEEELGGLRTLKHLSDDQINKVLQDPRLIKEFGKAKCKGKNLFREIRSVFTKLKVNNFDSTTGGITEADLSKYNFKCDFRLVEIITGCIEKYPEIKEYFLADAYCSANSGFLQGLRENDLISEFAVTVFRLWILGTPGETRGVPNGMGRVLNLRKNKDRPIFVCDGKCTVEKHKNMFFALVAGFISKDKVEEEKQQGIGRGSPSPVKRPKLDNHSEKDFQVPRPSSNSAESLMRRVDVSLANFEKSLHRAEQLDGRVDAIALKEAIEAAGLWTEELDSMVSFEDLKATSPHRYFFKLMLWAASHQSTASTTATLGVVEDEKGYNSKSIADMQDAQQSELPEYSRLTLYLGNSQLGEDFLRLNYAAVWKIIEKWRETGDLDEALSACGIAVDETARLLAEPISELIRRADSGNSEAILQEQMLARLGTTSGAALLWPLWEYPDLRHLYENTIILSFSYMTPEEEASSLYTLSLDDRNELAHIVIDALSALLLTIHSVTSAEKTENPAGELRQMEAFWNNIRLVAQGKDRLDQFHNRMVTWTCGDAATAAGLEWTQRTRELLTQYRSRVRSEGSMTESEKRELYCQLRTV